MEQIIYAGLNIPQYSEDAAHTTGDKGVPSLVVRKDTAASLAGSDGDYSMLAVDSLGRLHTNVGLINSYVSSANSTSATLTSGGSFTGTAEDVSNYATVSIQVKASHASASNGLSLQFSIDGTNWDFTTSYTVSANSTRFVSVPRAAKYFRVVYTTNNNNQTYFRLQTIFSTLSLTPSNVIDSELPSAATLTDGTVTTYTVPSVGAVGMMFNGTQYDRVRGSATDGLLVNLGTNNDVTITSGTVTANAGTDLNTSALALETTATSINNYASTISGCVSGTEMQVDVITMPTTNVAQSGTWNISDISGTISLPTGAATELKQDDIITSLNSIDLNTYNISQAITLNKMQVDVITIPSIVIDNATNPIAVSQSGTWSIDSITTSIPLPPDAATETTLNTVASNIVSVNNVLDDIYLNTSSLATTVSGGTIAVSATGLDIRYLTAADVVTVNGGMAQTDDVKVTLDSELVVLGPSTDHIGKITVFDGTTEAEVIPLTTYNGLAVAIVDGNGDHITSFGGGTQYTEGDIDVTITGTVMMMEVGSDTVQPVQGTVANGLLVNVSNASIPATQSGTWNITNVSGTVSLPTGASTSANQTTIIGHLDGVEGLLTTIDADTGNISTKIDTIAGAVSGTEMQVDVLTLPNVAQATASNLNAQVVGATAHDAADAGNPIKIGGKASTTLPTAVSASGDRVDATFDRHGYLIVRTANQAVNAWTQVHEPATNTQATCVQAAPGANLKNIVTSITGTLAAGSTAPTAVQLYLRLVEDAAGTPATIWTAAISLPATAGASSGIALTNLWIPVTSNKSITLRFSAAGGTNTYETVSMQGIIVAE